MRRLSVSNTVLLIICLMYLILYVDRVNISTAAPLIKADLDLSNTELGLVFSAFAYPYALFQLIGGYFGDKFGARLTLFVSGLIVCAATAATGAVGGLASLFAARLALGIGEGATFPTATRAMAAWVPERSWGFAQGITHSSARIGNALTPPLIALLVGLVSWRGAFVVLALLSLVWVLVWLWYFRDVPAAPPLTAEELANASCTQPRQCDQAGAVVQVISPHAAGDRGRFLLRLDAVAVSELDTVVLLPELSAEPDAIGILFGRRLPCRRDRRHLGRRGERPDPAPHRRPDRGAA